MLDYLVAGAGLYGSVFGRTVAEQGRKVLVIDRRAHPGGNIWSYELEGIQVHSYGPHAFHTNSPEIWNYVNRFAEFNGYRHKVKANFRGKIYSLPFNMATFHQFWGVTTPAEAQKVLKRKQRKIEKPRNMEEWAVANVGREIYESLIYGYTKKQWRREPKDLPASILRRIPVRFDWNDDYHNDAYQGVPIKGYGHLIENVLDGLDFKNLTELESGWEKYAKKLVYSGSLDELFGYKHGLLEYRSLDFLTEIVDGDFQGCTQMNYTSDDVPYTRIVEAKHFVGLKSKKSVITYEYPKEWHPEAQRYYPINDRKNNAVFEKYKKEAAKHDNIIYGGRLGSFRYMDMDQVIASALHDAHKELGVKTS
jgi:UDP-galactopyranose mutase